MLTKGHTSNFLNLFTILSFYQTGTLNTFKLAVEKVLKYSEILLDESSTTKLTHYICKRFYELGIIEIAEHQNERIWEISRNSLVTVSNDKHVLIGDKVFCDLLTQNFESALGSHSIFNVSQKLCSNFHFSAPTINCELTRIKCNPNNLPEFNHVDVRSISLLRLLPTIQDSLRHINKINSKTLIDQNQIVLSYNFTKKSWNQEYTEHLSEPGYYQIKYRFGPPSFLIKTKNDFFELKERDLGFLLAYYVLNFQIHIRYNHKDKSMLMDYQDFYNLPIIFKRLLLLKSFSLPQFSGKKVVIPKVDFKEFNYLKDNYKIFAEI